MEHDRNASVISVEGREPKQTFVWAVIANTSNGVSNHLLIVHSGSGRDLTTQQHQASLTHCLWFNKHSKLKGCFPHQLWNWNSDTHHMPLWHQGPDSGERRELHRWSGHISYLEHMNWMPQFPDFWVILDFILPLNVIRVTHIIPNWSYGP